MKSIIFETERVRNHARRFGSAPLYYPSMVVLKDGQRMPALFTENELQDAIDRARDNPEDVPPERKPWWRFW